MAGSHAMGGSGCRALVIAMLAANHSSRSMAIRVVDVPTFSLQCKLLTTSRPTMGHPPPPPEPDAVFFFGDRDDMNTIDKNHGESASSGDWSSPPLNMTTEIINHTAHSYPNDEPPTKPFFEKWVAVSTKVMVRLSPAAYATHAATNTTPITCQMTFTGKDATHAAVTKSANISLRYSRDLCWPPTKAKLAAQQPCGGFMGLMLQRDNRTGEPIVENWREFNAHRYWPAMLSQPAAKHPKHFPVVDSFRGDDDIGTTADAIAAMSHVGYHGLAISVTDSSLKEAMQKTGQYDLHAASGGLSVPCSVQLPGERTAPACTIRDWFRSNDTDAELANSSRVDTWAQTLATSWKASGYTPETVKFGAMHDEPGWSWETPPITTSSVVKSRWIRYLQAQNLTPADLGSTDWSHVVPLGRADARKAILSSKAQEGDGTVAADAKLAARRLYYWSVRYVGWEPSQFFANATTALEENFGKVHLYANWNNFQGAQFVPGDMRKVPGPDSNQIRMSFDWFEYARLRGSYQLWTEDWMPDRASFRWSYYASRLRSSIALAGHDSMEFSGYIVPRSSGGRDGGLLQRIMTLIGSGAKGVRYFDFGPEYTFPINCYTENANYSRLIKEMAQAHGMIADVEPILWPARKPSAQIAILMPRSAEAWDLFNLSSTAATGYMHECCVTSSMLAYAADYNAEVFGIYTALATDEGLDVDFIDEDALSDSAALNRYKAIYVTQPNVPSHGLATLLLWVQAGGVLVTVSGAASYDEYNMPLQTAIASRPRERWYLQGSSSPDKLAGGCLFGHPGNTHTCHTHPGHALLPDGPAKFSAFGIRDNSVGLRDDEVVLASFADGMAAVTQKSVGQGSIVAYPWLPGVSYAYQRAIGAEAGLGILLRNISALAEVCPPVTISERRVEAPLMLTPDNQSAIITLLNWKCTEDSCTQADTKIRGLKVKAQLPFAATKLYSATHGDITPSPCPSSTKTCSGATHVVCFEVDLLFADFVTLSS